MKFLAPIFVAAVAAKPGFGNLLGPIIEGETCPDVLGSTNLTSANIEQYLGTWWQAAAVPFAFAAPRAQCTTAQYSYNSTTRVNVDNSGIQYQPKIDEWGRVHALGQAVYVAPGQLEVGFPFGGNPDYPPQVPSNGVGNYIILSTDVTSSEYTYIYSCDNVGKNKDAMKPIIWILVRDPSNNAFGMTTDQRIEEALAIWSSYGASDNAVNQVRESFRHDNLDPCGAHYPN